MTDSVKRNSRRSSRPPSASTGAPGATGRPRGCPEPRGTLNGGPPASSAPGGSVLAQLNLDVQIGLLASGIDALLVQVDD